MGCWAGAGGRAYYTADDAGRIALKRVSDHEPAVVVGEANANLVSIAGDGNALWTAGYAGATLRMALPVRPH